MVYSKEVESQYSQWIYPVPVDDMAEAISSGQHHEGIDPNDLWPLYWPHKRSLPQHLNVLIAGCGTNQAAYHALRLPQSTITAIDLSETSLAHEQQLKDKHNLTNLTLHKMDLTKVAELSQSYDFIVSTGVLHHLPEPLEGFRALRSVLRREGVMAIMVYGTAMRLGVYLMQKFFRLCDFQQTPQDVVLAKQTVKLLKPDHVLQKYIKVGTDLVYDAGWVDTFLHRQDRSYYIPEIMDVVHNAGLEWLGWMDNLHYCLEGIVPARHPLWSRLNKLDALGKAHAYELLAQDKGTHTFACCHPEYAQKCRFSFDDDSILDCAIIVKNDARIEAPIVPKLNTPVHVKRGQNVFNVDCRLYLLLQAMDGGTRTLREAFASVGNHGITLENTLAAARDGFKTLYNLGVVLVLLGEE